MPQHRRDDQGERMRSAAENLKKIMEELAPYEKRQNIKEISTAGTWQASPDASVGVSTIDTEQYA